MKSLSRLIRQSALALMTGLLLIFSLLIYIGGDTLLRRSVDARVLGLAETLAQIIERRPDLVSATDHDLVLPDEGGASQEERHELREVAHSVLVFSVEGRLVWKGSAAVTPPAVREVVLERVRRGETVFETVQRADGLPLRRVFIPIPRHGEVRYVLQAQASLLLYQKTLEGLVLLLIVASGAIIVIAWRGGDWLARKVLTPIEMLSTSAETISAANLGQRLSLDSPYGEFRRLTQAFNAVMDRFQKSCDSQRHFVDHAAHEMQTPLTVLQGHLEVTLQKKTRTAEEYREALIGNLEQVGRLITLTRSLLTLTKFAGDSPPVQLAPLALEPLLRELVTELAILAEDRGITFSLEAHPVPRVLGDTLWLKQALINLLDNALRYTPRGGGVTVRLQTCAGTVTIAVEDTGQGIEPEHLPYLFDRFYRTDRARARDSGGTGLGLSIVQGIVEAHGGTITVKSQVDKGSVFTLRLPIATGRTTPA